MILLFHLFLFVSLLPLFLVKYRRARLNFVLSTIIAFTAGVVFGAIGWTTTVAIGVATLIGYVGAALIYGGLALSISRKKASGLSNSPTYAQATLQTQTNPDLPIPLLYGTVKLAGNRIWQNDTSEKNIKRIVAFADGEITDFTEIKLNDIDVNTIAGNKVEKFYGTSTQGLPSMVTLDKVGSLRNVAYLAITCNKTDKIDINYNLTCIVKGRKVRVYTSPTHYEIKYSENPAWVLFDFLTSYNGLGLALDNKCKINEALVAELFDLETFIESASFCDETVTTNGETSPRFTFNMIFDSQTSARDLIDEIYRSCRGGLFSKNGKLQFKIDKAEPVSQVFTTQDIITGSETFQLIPAEEHYEILRCSYVSPKHEWQKVEAFAEIPVYRYGTPIEHSVNIYSCTNFQQASRLAWYYINSKVLCPYFGSFQTDYRAYTLEVGDVIKINSLLMGLDNYLVKVTSVADDGSGVFTVNWRNYDERLYNDTLGCQEPRVLISNLGDIAVFPDDVRNFNVVQSNNYFNFVWQLNANAQDVYEIRYGDSWENGKIIAKNLETNSFSWQIPTDGLYKFWIKAFNNYNYSKNATLDIYSVDSLPKVNEIIKFNLFNDLRGTYTDTYYYKRFRAIKVKSHVKWQTLEGQKWENNLYYSTYGKWGAGVVEQAYYTSQVYDVGAVLSSIVAVNLSYTCDDESQIIIPEWRYSKDGTNWSDWKVCNIGEYDFRYYQFRAVFHAYNGVQMFLKSFAVSVDVPDKEIEMDVEIPESGELKIDYNFINIPSIIGTVNDDIEAYVVVQSSTKTNKSAVIQAYKNDGTKTGAKVNLRLKGY